MIIVNPKVMMGVTLLVLVIECLKAEGTVVDEVGSVGFQLIDERPCCVF